MIYTLSTSKLQLSPCYLFPDTQTLEQSAQEFTPERVGEFLEEIGLGDHVASFIEQEISGDMLLEDTVETDEMLEELGVESATEKLMIKVYGRIGVLWYASKGVQMPYRIWGHAPFSLQKDVFQLDVLMFSLALLGPPYCHWNQTKVDKVEEKVKVQE